MNSVCDSCSQGCAALCGAKEDVQRKAGQGLDTIDAKGSDAMGSLGTVCQILCIPFGIVTSRPLGLYVLVTMIAMTAEAYYGVVALLSPQFQACGPSFLALAVFDICFGGVHIILAWYCSGRVMAAPRQDLLLGRRTSSAIADEVLAHTNVLLAQDKLFAFYFLSWVVCLIVNFMAFAQLDSCHGTDLGFTLTNLMFFQIFFGLVYGFIWYTMLSCGCTACCSCLFVFESPETSQEPSGLSAPLAGPMGQPSAPPLPQSRGKTEVATGTAQRLMGDPKQGQRIGGQLRPGNN